MHWYSILNGSLISTNKVCGLGKGKKSPETILHVHLQPYDFSLEWNSLLLAYLEGSWIIMTSGLIGCFTVLLNVELCSDWLFHSAA